MKRMRWYDLIVVNLFWLGLNIRNNAVGTIFMPYLVDRFVSPDIRNTALGGMRTAGLIIAMLVQPAMGLLSDRSTSRFGRRRPFILVGSLLDVLFLALIAWSTSYWMLLTVILFQQFSANVSHGPLQGLIPDLVPEDQRGVASAVKAILELLPLVLLGITIAPLVGAGRFGLSVAVTGALLLVLAALTMFLVREKPLDVRPDVPLGPTMLRILGMLAGIAAGAAAGLLVGAAAGALAGLAVWLFRDAGAALGAGVAVGGIVAMAVAVVAGVWAGAWATIGPEVRQHRSYTWWMVNRLMFLAAVTSIQGFAPFFLMYAFEVDREAAAQMTGTLVAAVGVCTLLSALPSGWLADRMGQRRLLLGSSVLAVIGTAVVVTTVWMPRLWLVYLAGGLLGLAVGPFMTSNWALGTRLVPPRQAGRYLGISNLAGAGAGMIGAGIGGPVADYLNELQPGLGYVIIFAGYGILFLLSAVTLSQIRDESL